MSEKAPFGDLELDQLFREARSYKRFENAPVSEATIHAIYELMKWGPTATNTTPGRFKFLVSEEARRRLADRADANNVAKIMSAPCVTIVAYDLDFHLKMGVLAPHAPDAVNWWPEEETRHYEGLRNSSLQGAWLIMAARSLGLDCGPMGGFNREAVSAEFWPQGRIFANFIIALGKGSPEKLRPRAARLPFDETCEIL